MSVSRSLAVVATPWSDHGLLTGLSPLRVGGLVVFEYCIIVRLMSSLWPESASARDGTLWCFSLSLPSQLTVLQPNASPDPPPPPPPHLHVVGLPPTKGHSLASEGSRIKMYISCIKYGTINSYEMKCTCTLSKLSTELSCRLAAKLELPFSHCFSWLLSWQLVTHLCLNGILIFFHYSLNNCWSQGWLDCY